jgi:hypothetical protein
MIGGVLGVAIHYLRFGPKVIQEDEPEVLTPTPRPGHGFNFGVSPFPSGVIAFSRILNDQEVVVVANTNTQQEFTGEVIVDRQLNAAGSSYQIRFSNKGSARANPVFDKPKASVRITEVGGAVTDGPARSLRVQLQPMEIQILRQ